SASRSCSPKKINQINLGAGAGWSLKNAPKFPHFTPLIIVMKTKRRLSRRQQLARAVRTWLRRHRHCDWLALQQAALR
ncbi:MAG: hypothetical protein KGL39_36870, partial [Patescibacteria group bacterium]|nr:hypothetical protein [Patescibacteria group bacterium]